MDKLQSDDLRRLYRYLRLTRGLEERLDRLFKQGKTVGGLYRSLGQEATAIGTAYALGPGDWLAPSIRDMGAMLVRGLPPVEMLIQYLARDSRFTHGKDNTTHLTDHELGLVGPISPLGTQLCVLNGVALSFRLRRQDRVCMTYQGDGASRTGASHEGMALAAAANLPIVVILEHNRWAFGTRSDREAAVRHWADVGQADGLPVRSVDGNDVIECYDAATDAVARARSGEGPTLIVAETYRMLGHAQHDAQKYVPPEELEEWRARDPIDRYHETLVVGDILSEEELAAVSESVDRELDLAVDEALAMATPQPESALTDVYEQASDPREPPWTRRPVVGYPDLSAPA
jgi:TPP-dependent pyruvate/acetoin dehydrogenase alpha subunit